MGAIASVNVDDLITYYKTKHDLTIEELPAVALQINDFHLLRGQYTAEKLIASLKQAYPEYARDPNAVLIGILAQDMFIYGKTWKFAFSYREEGHLCVVSSFRMGLPSVKESQTDEFEQDHRHFLSPNKQSRLIKMISKNIGLLYFEYAANNNPHSVMYNNIMGIDELDVMGEDY